MVGAAEKYMPEVKKAIRLFWKTRDAQLKKQSTSRVIDHGTRGAVTGGKQMDGFVLLLKKVAIDVGIPEEHIHLRGTDIPGFFRPSKNWDIIITSPKNHLIACAELKSQVGSFGNNFNNRTEEALGSSVDILEAYSEGAFPNQDAPWLGYLIVVEKSKKSTTPVRVNEPHFKVFEEFRKTSYLQRYSLLCKRLVQKRRYDSAALIWTSNANRKLEFGFIENGVSFESFINAYIGHLKGKLFEYEK